MTIIAGLGNPGKEYQNTPHNVGFEAVDKLAKESGFPDFEFDKYANALISKKGDIVLAKPQTFMNASGQSIKKLLEVRPLKNLHAALERSDLSWLIVIHDDIDLPLGKIRVSKNRGSAGHKGIESIINELGTKDFIRIRIGVSKEKKPNVLKKFTKQDKEILKEAFTQVSLELANLCHPREGGDPGPF